MPDLAFILNRLSQKDTRYISNQTKKKMYFLSIKIAILKVKIAILKVKIAI